MGTATYPKIAWLPRPHWSTEVAIASCAITAGIAAFKLGGVAGWSLGVAVALTLGSFLAGVRLVRRVFSLVDASIADPTARASSVSVVLLEEGQLVISVPMLRHSARKTGGGSK